MRDTFHGWAAVDKMDIDVVADLIITGRKASEVRPDTWLFSHIGNSKNSLVVLDFGCGFGRNSFGMAMYGENWTVIGYDNEGMLSRVPEFFAINYSGKIPNNLWFVSEWNQIVLHKIDVIFCSLVLQHIYEDALMKYIQDFKQMTNKLIVTGRRFNDGKGKRSTWTILEEHGLIPDEFYGDCGQISYVAEGDPTEHNMAIYNLQAK